LSGVQKRLLFAERKKRRQTAACGDGRVNYIHMRVEITYSLDYERRPAAAATGSVTLPSVSQSVSRLACTYSFVAAAERFADCSRRRRRRRVIDNEY